MTVPTASPGRARRAVLLAAAPLIVLDQVTKAVAVARLEGASGVRLLGDVLRLDLTRNSGAAFSLGAGGATWAFTLLAAGVVVAFMVYAPALTGARSRLAAGLLVAGACGNLLDRLFRSPGFGRGHVVDFIHIRDFPIFNCADMCITAAACLFIVTALRPAARVPQGGDEGSA